MSLEMFPIILAILKHVKKDKYSVKIFLIRDISY